MNRNFIYTCTYNTSVLEYRISQLPDFITSTTQSLSLSLCFSFSFCYNELLFYGVVLVLKFVIFIFLLLSNLYAADSDSIANISKELKLIPASKAIVQWERVFSSEKRKQRYHIDQLTPDVQLLLKEYLIDHAADSSQPMVPGL